MIKKVLTAQSDAHRLDHFLFTELNQTVSKSLIRKLIILGSVYLNKKRIKIASKPIRAQSQVTIYLPNPTPVLEVNIKQRIVFEDEWLIVVSKPAGLPTCATLDQDRVHLTQYVKEYLKELAPQAYLGIHHRLDRDTSGLILFTKSETVNKPISDLFLNRKIKKTYEFISSSLKPVLPQWEVKNYLATVGRKGKKRLIGAVTSGGDLAHTSFKLHLKNSSFYWIEAFPHTGRTHQVRVHAASSGLPICGDQHYGGLIKHNYKPIPRVLLHAKALEFLHPITQKNLLLKQEAPEDFWSFWQSVLSY